MLIVLIVQNTYNVYVYGEDFLSGLSYQVINVLSTFSFSLSLIVNDIVIVRIINK